MTVVPTLADVAAAAARIAPHVHRTPVVTCTTIDRRIGATVFAKAENLQKVGAFKARGATNAVLAAPKDSLEHGIATHSSGNHGQAVAYAAAIAGTKATIVMPDHAPNVKLDAVRGYGAEIVLCAQSERQATLERLVADTGAHVVHPFDDPFVIAGQGTATLELCEDVPELDCIVAPIGGGGLLSGATIVAQARGIPTIGAEPSVVDDAARSLRDGRRYPATGEISVGDGLLVGIGEIPFTILTRAGSTVITVSEEEILEAMRYVVTRTKLVIEPSAATAYAALFARPELFAGSRVGLIITGGNVALETLSRRD